MGALYISLALRVTGNLNRCVPPVRHPLPHFTRRPLDQDDDVSPAALSIVFAWTRLFDRFFRCENAGAPGTGLGLTM